MIDKTTDPCNVTHVAKGTGLKYELELREESGIIRDVYISSRCLLSSKRNHFLLQCIGVLDRKTVGRMALTFF